VVSVSTKAKDSILIGAAYLNALRKFGLKPYCSDKLQSKTQLLFKTSA